MLIFVGDEEVYDKVIRFFANKVTSLLIYNVVFVTHARFSSFFDLKRGSKVTFFFDLLE